MTPEVSIIVPAHNRRAMVAEAIASVIAQRGVSFELIVVDDGSTDGTSATLERIAAGSGANPVIIERAEHRAGPAAARNRGLGIARAPLVAFLDSDDLWAPDKLARQLAFMRANPALAISQTQEIWIRNGRRVNPGRRHLKRAGDFFVDSLRTCPVSPSSVIARADLLRSVGGFDESMLACEDYDLWLRILAGHKIGLLDEYLVTRRAGHRDQLSATIPALDRFRILALMKLLGDPELPPEHREAAASVLAEKCRIYAKGLSRRKRDDEARWYEDVADRTLASWRIAADVALDAAIAAMRAAFDAGVTMIATEANRAEHPSDRL
jgi:glycosyltransferase involved in cell wall biosynthesis